MKFIFDFFKKRPFSNSEKSNPSNKSNKDIEKATNFALDRYSKTFKDLARYDRREKILN